MRFTTVVASALSASAVIAAPYEKRAVTTTWVVDVVTQYTTVYGSPKATPSPVGALQQSSSPPAPVVVPKTTTPVAAPPPAPTTPVVVPAPAPEPTTSAAPAPAPAPSSGPSSGPSGPANYGNCVDFPRGSTPDFSTPPSTCGISVLDTINKWRSFYNKPAYKWNANMAHAAWDTVVANGGGVHENHPKSLAYGSNGETIAPGFFVPGGSLSSKMQGDSPFEVALVAWLCEVPSDSQLKGSGPSGVDQCPIATGVASISYDGNTGHHDIFLGDYVSIGCAFMPNVQGDGGWPQFEGQWACDYSLS